jgi:hypothetical protein
MEIQNKMRSINWFKRSRAKPAEKVAEGDRAEGTNLRLVGQAEREPGDGRGVS